MLGLRPSHLHGGPKTWPLLKKLNMAILRRLTCLHIDFDEDTDARRD